MLSSPTTDEIIEGLRVELREAVLPEVPAASGRLAIEMLDNLLSNLAVRSAHEIAWMRDECEQIEQLGASVDDVQTQAALSAYRAADRVSLHLADVQAAYELASEALSCTLEYAVSNSDVALVAAARKVLRLRNERELQVIGDWQMIGRG